VFVILFPVMHPLSETDVGRDPDKTKRPVDRSTGRPHELVDRDQGALGEFLVDPSAASVATAPDSR
jgi:hypothetical protein